MCFLPRGNCLDSDMIHFFASYVAEFEPLWQLHTAETDDCLRVHEVSLVPCAFVAILKMLKTAATPSSIAQMAEVMLHSSSDLKGTTAGDLARYRGLPLV